MARCSIFIVDRRAFIKKSCLAALSVPFAKFDLLPEIKNRKLPAIGIQLYMVRENMAKDPSGTLLRLGRMGYTQLESYNSDKGIFWGYSDMEFSRIARDNGLQVVSSHYEGDREGYRKTAAEAAEAGIKYLIYPWNGPQKSIEDFKRIAEKLNGYGAICKKNDLRFGYHPHDYSQKKVNGRLPINILLDYTDPDLVDFEMDFYHTVIEKQDPEYYIKKYKPRFRLCHMRDVLKVRLPSGGERVYGCDLGQGIINYPRLLSTAMKNGMSYFFVEQSWLSRETALESAAINAGYLKKLNLD